MKKIAVFLVIATLVLGVSGCSFFKKPPQEAVNEGLLKYMKVEKMASSFQVKGTVLSPSADKTNKFEFTLNISGASSGLDKNIPQSDTKWDFLATAEGLTSSGQVLMRVVEKKIFLNLVSLDISGDAGASLKTQLSNVLNKWWVLPIGEDSSFMKFTDEQQKLKEKVSTSKFFVNASEEGSEEVKGMAATRYRVDLDKDVLKDLILQVARIGGNQVNPDEEQAIQESLKDVDFSGAVWIGDDDVLHRVQGTLTIRPSEGPSSTFDIDFTGWDYGKAVSIAAPESSQDFNPLVLFPIMNAFTSVTSEESATLPGVPGGVIEGAVSGAAIDAPLGAAQVKR